MQSLADMQHLNLFDSVVLSVAAINRAPTIPLTKAAMLSGGILLITLFLGLWQWFDQTSRDAEPSDEDRQFFRQQDRRRYRGIAVMVALALAMPAEPLFFSLLPNGSILHSKAWGGLVSIAIWMAVCIMIVVLLALAFVDLLATRHYARRHRRALNHERSKLMLEMIHRSGPSDSGVSSERKKSV